MTLTYNHDLTLKNKEFLSLIENNPDIEYIQSLIDSTELNKGKSDGYIIPQHVSIELTPESTLEICSKILNKREKSVFRYLKKVDDLGYKEFNQILMSSNTKINFLYDGKFIFTIPVPKGVFNPFIGPIGGMFVEKIIHADIDVKGKRVIDLGCGCGNFGYISQIMGAEEILFTDVHDYHIKSLKEIKFLSVKKNEYKSQNLLQESFKDESKKEYYDIIISSTPTFSTFTSVELNKTSNELFTFSDFYKNLSEQSYFLLKPKGKLSLWSMIANFNAKSLFNFMQNFSVHYHISDWRIVALDKQTNIGIFNKDEEKDDNVYMFYEITKDKDPKMISNDDFKLKFIEIIKLLEKNNWKDHVKDFNDFINF